MPNKYAVVITPNNYSSHQETAVRILKILIVATLCICSFASAQSNQNKLVVHTPEYWGTPQTIHNNDFGRGISVIGRIPANQTKTNIEESIWENRFPSMSLTIPVVQFANEMLKQYWMLCETLRTTSPIQKKERTYDAVYVQATCNRVKADPQRAIMVRAKYMCSANDCYAVAHEFALHSYEATKGGESSTIPNTAFGDKDKVERFKNYLEASPLFLQNNVFLCNPSEDACK